MTTAAMHGAWERQTMGDAAADAATARSNSTFTRSSVAVLTPTDQCQMADYLGGLDHLGRLV